MPQASEMWNGGVCINCLKSLLACVVLERNEYFCACCRLKTWTHFAYTQQRCRRLQNGSYTHFNHNDETSNIIVIEIGVCVCIWNEWVLLYAWSLAKIQCISMCGKKNWMKKLETNHSNVNKCHKKNMIESENLNERRKKNECE